MIKIISTSFTPSIREWVSMPGYTPQMADAFRFIGSLNMLIGGIVVFPSNREQLNSFFDANDKNHSWLKDVFQRASRAVIHVSHERDDLVRVDVLFYHREEREKFANITCMFDDDGVVSTSHTSEDVAA